MDISSFAVTCYKFISAHRIAVDFAYATYLACTSETTDRHLTDIRSECVMSVHVADNTGTPSAIMNIESAMYKHTVCVNITDVDKRVSDNDRYTRARELTNS